MATIIAEIITPDDVYWAGFDTCTGEKRTVGYTTQEECQQAIEDGFTDDNAPWTDNHGGPKTSRLE